MQLNKPLRIGTLSIKPSKVKDKTATQKWQPSLNKDYKQSHNTKKMQHN